MPQPRTEGARALRCLGRTDRGRTPHAAPRPVRCLSTISHRERHTTIGQAIGIVIERQHCSPDEAFAVLRASSQRHNVKLRVAATELVASTSRRGDVREPQLDGRTGLHPARRPDARAGGGARTA
ncbi:ANTAR domain-containing protein [Pseudonocardia sp. 73-21]|uniref:ANTAR domain-containing protein n=1 Tax=Pseudonocardia sp. 73-21 TaxID=1895809 RepID=UPI002633F831|nr:ANTAR domain-containing protein [Pseudonocardia sp. 73-21]